MRLAWRGGRGESLHGLDACPLLVRLVWHRLDRRGLQHTHLLQELPLDAGANVRVVTQVVLGVLPALTDALTGVGVPGAALLDDVLGRGHVEEVSLPGDAGS